MGFALPRLTSSRLWIAVSMAIGGAVLFFLGAYVAERVALPRLAERGEATLTLLSDRLTGQLDVYRYLPASLARHPNIVAALRGEQDAAETLQRIADVSGALQVFVMDKDGTAIAASRWDNGTGIVGENYAWRPYFQRAMDGALGFYHAVGVPTGVRGFYFAHPVWDEAGNTLGVVTVTVDLERLESAWRGVPEVAFFTDDRGVVFVTNRDTLVLRALGPVGRGDPQQYGELVPEPLPEMPAQMREGYRIWTDMLASELPDKAIWLSKPLPALGLEAHVLVDTDGVREFAALGGLLAAAIGAAGVGISGLLFVRRRAFAQMLALEAEANLRLERDVAERTSDLQEANSALREEVSDRMAAEAQLRQVQVELVQAGKLKALGEMSAGMSHELNQPLTAIQSLADNCEVLLERGNTEGARETLSRIGQIAGRMGRIIRNLRAFSRKEGESVGTVDLGAVVSDALALAEGRLRAAETELIWAPPAHPVMVRGGKVRLGQVILNLVSNAVDAMAGRDERWLSFEIQEDGPSIRLIVCDTGPGLSDPGEVFTPFYTTKPVGEGLGLGLSISYGIVQSFGGKITGGAAPGGGAMFTMELVKATREMAAE